MDSTASSCSPRVRFFLDGEPHGPCCMVRARGRQQGRCRSADGREAPAGPGGSREGRSSRRPPSYSAGASARPRPGAARLLRDAEPARARPPRLRAAVRVVCTCLRNAHPDDVSAHNHVTECRRGGGRGGPPPCGRDGSWCSPVEKSLEVPQKTGNSSHMDPAAHSWRMPRKYFEKTRPCVDSSTIYNSQGMEAT